MSISWFYHVYLVSLVFEFMCLIRDLTLLKLF